MKKILLSTFTCLAIMSANSQGDPNLAPGQMPPSAPAVAQNPEFIQFKELSYDFGNIKQGTPVSHIFEFKNVGTRDVTLVNVAASCGCTTPNWKGGIYNPQTTAQITATYNAASEGFFNKVITVTTSEGVNILTITGNVLSAAAYDEWKIKKDAEDAAKAKAEAANKKGKSKSAEKNKKGMEKKDEAKAKVESKKEEVEKKHDEHKSESDAKKEATKTKVEAKKEAAKSKTKKPEVKKETEEKETESK